MTKESNDSKSTRGGKRVGAGRKPWSEFKEPTVPIRIPLSQESVVRDFVEAFKKKNHVAPESVSNVDRIQEPSLDPSKVELPLFSTKVAAGYPSPADETIEKRIDLNDYLINKADATFFVTIKGDSMIDAGIFEGDVAVIDSPIEIKEGMSFEIWGVVTGTVRKFV